MLSDIVICDNIEMIETLNRDTIFLLEYQIDN